MRAWDDGVRANDNIEFTCKLLILLKFLYPNQLSAPLHIILVALAGSHPMLSGFVHFISSLLWLFVDLHVVCFIVEHEPEGTPIHLPRIPTYQST